jgi:hypothetical protein
MIAENTPCQNCSNGSDYNIRGCGGGMAVD